MARRRRTRALAQSLRVEQDPTLLADYKSAAMEAFSDFYGFDLPIAVVQRALERTFISLADQVAHDLPHSVSRGGKGRLPHSGDRERWLEIEMDVYRHLLRSYRGRAERSSRAQLPPMVEPAHAAGTIS